MDSYDLVIIGAGPGGYVAAIRAGQLGLKTALVEKNDTLGGTCLNVGCIPSKALLEASHHYYAAKNEFAEFGVNVGELSLDIDKMMAHKMSCVQELTGGIKILMKKNKVTVYHGTGSLADAAHVSVATADGDELKLEAKAIVLATGSAPVELPFMKFDGETIVSSTEALAFGNVPEHLAVIGGGVVGLELGSVWSRLGAQVTVIEMLDRITPFADKMISQTLERSLKRQGLDIRTKTKLKGAQIAAGKATLTIEDKNGESTFVADKVLVAVGRRPYHSGLGLESADIKTDAAGRIVVDDHFRTAAGSVYAIGDLIDGPMLAHKAEEEGIAVAEIIAGKPGHVNRAAIPNVVYTFPELAQVGLTEEQCKDAGKAINVGKYFYKGNGRAKSMQATDGLVKVIADAETDRILGVHIVGANASEMIGEVVAAFEFSASAEDLGRMVHAHPTLSEIIKEAALAVNKAAIHG